MSEHNYHVVYADNLTKLMETVVRLLQEGWQCAGGIFRDTSGTYFQAMTYFYSYED